MRRNGGNMNRQRGGYSAGGGGSESHLSNQLHNLDMELQLLKRKREIIEQEQNMFNRFSINTRQDNYEQPFYTYNQQEPKQHQYNVGNFSSAYEASSSSNYNKPPGNKRQSNINWRNQNPSPPKRFNAPQRINPWQSSETRQDFIPLNQDYKPQPQPKTFSAPPRPILDMKPSISQKMKNRYVPPPRNDFRPTKVTKIRPQPYPPKKLVKKPMEDTQKIISEANKLIAQTNKATNNTPPIIKQKPQVTPTSNNKYNILCATKPPTLQMKGRLELALGTIVKEIREKKCTDPKDLEFFTIPFIQRLIKHTLRTRIRNVMMNQTIDSVSDIVARYRNEYPRETDNELMKLVKDAQTFASTNRNVGVLIAADDPEYFFRKNMMNVIIKKFDDMIADLKKLYEEKTYNFEEYLKQFAKETEKIESDNKSKLNEKNEEGSNSQKESDDKVNTNLNSDKITDNIGDSFSRIKHYAEFMNKLIDERLPRILAHFKDDVFLTMCLDKEFLGIKAMIVAETKVKLQKEIEKRTITIDDNECEPQAKPNRVTKRKLDSKISSEPAIVPKRTVSTLDATSTIPATSVTPTTLVPSISPGKSLIPDNSELLVPAISENITDTSAKGTEHASLTPAESSKSETSITTNEIPEQCGISNTVNEISENGSSATSAMSTADVSLASSNKPVSSMTPIKSTISMTIDSTAPSTPITPAADKSAPTPTTPPSKDISYVKLIGRPSLPARAVIYEFLKKFNPSSIKKHKSINNLLVIGFTDKEGFENILAANESVVGDATVIIKASEQVTNTPLQKKGNETKPATVQQAQSLIDTPVLKKGSDFPKNEDISLEEIKMNDYQKKSSASPIQNKADDSLNNVNSSLNEVISDLDNQITDLLSSIRKANEDDAALEDQNRSDYDKQLDATPVSISTEESNKKSGISAETKTEEVKEASTTQQLGTITETGNEKVSDVSEKLISTTKELETIAETDKNEKVSDVNEKTISTTQDSITKQFETIAEVDENAKLTTVSNANLKESGRATPTRSSARLASTTPSTIKTRRTSRLANNDTK